MLKRLTDRGSREHLEEAPPHMEVAGLVAKLQAPNSESLDLLLNRFTSLRIEKRYLYGACWRPSPTTRRRWSTTAWVGGTGWHVMIEAMKPR